MGARAWVAALAALLVGMVPVSSWAQPKAKKAADECDKKSTCDITVVVGDKCAIYVVPEEMRVREKNTKVKMVWTIDKGSTGNAEFARDDGIVFKKADHRDEFDDNFKESANKYRWKNKNDLPGKPKKRRYEYSVNVIQKGKACPTYDPTIINDY